MTNFAAFPFNCEETAFDGLSGGRSVNPKHFMNGAYLGSDNEAVPVIPLTYDDKAERFLCKECEPLANRVIACGRDKKITPAAQSELLKNLELCLPRGDFCLTEELCLRMREGAENQPERNYWTAALLLIWARLGRL